MLSIRITETGLKEIERLKIDVEKSLNTIFEYIPIMDLIGLKYIWVTYEPGDWKKHLANAMGSYSKKTKKEPAFVELYLSRLFGHVKSVESAKFLAPIWNMGLAQTVFHEVGHHVEKLRSHGIRKEKREAFAIKYENDLLSKYLYDNTESINTCFQNLEKVSEEKGLSQDI